MSCSGCTENGLPVCAGRIRYVPPVWNDARTAATATNVGTANAPPFTKLLDDGGGSVGVYTYQFPNNVDRELFFWVQLSHEWFEGSTLKPHIHWAAVDSGAGDVVWGLEYTKATPMSVLPASTLITVIDPTVTTALYHQVALLPDIAAAGDKISTMLGCRLYREGSAGADTYGNSAAFLEVDFHIMLNTPGSNEPFIK